MADAPVNTKWGAVSPNQELWARRGSYYDARKGSHYYAAVSEIRYLPEKSHFMSGNNRGYIAWLSQKEK